MAITITTAPTNQTILFIARSQFAHFNVMSFSLFRITDFAGRPRR